MISFKRLETALLAFALVVSMAQSKKPDPLAEARQLYNAQRYDDAIRAAETASHDTGVAAAASVILGRAHLERYRVTSDGVDLTSARLALKNVQMADLSPHDQVELVIGLGESMYYDDQYSFDDRYTAAAEEFELALARASVLDDASRDALFDWWAQSLDHQAQQGPESDRVGIYQRILARATDEVARPDGAPSASYWLAASAAGVGDVSRAMGAGKSGWVRAGAMGKRGPALRDDLNRLVTLVILPQRAEQSALGPDRRRELSRLLSEWEEFKQSWQ